MDLVELLRLEAHALRDAQQRGGRAVRVARQRVGRHAGVPADEVHLHRRRVVLQSQESLPHHGIPLRNFIQTFDRSLLVLIVTAARLLLCLYNYAIRHIYLKISKNH